MRCVNLQGTYLHYLFRLFFTKKIVKTRVKGTMNKGFS